MFDDTRTWAKDLTTAELADILRADAFSQWDGTLDPFGKARINGYRGTDIILDCTKGELRTRGSLATFANGHNTQLLNFAEVGRATADLAAAVGLPASRLPVVRLELSVDGDLSTSPRPFLESLVHHQRSKFCAVKPTAGVARPLEYYATHADYGIKFYDKGAWAAQQGNPLPAGQHKLRLEVVFTRARTINALLNGAEVTLADLATPSFYAAAAAELHKHWRLTTRIKPVDFTGLTMTDIGLLQSGSNPDYWRGLRAVRSAITIKRYKARYKELVAASEERTGTDTYDLLFPAAIATLLAPAVKVGNDTILHTLSQLEYPPVTSSPEALPMTISRGASAAKEEYQPTHTDDGLKRCQTCGRPITTGNALAKFCSPKERGEAAAKHCRNADSNLRNNLRRRVQKMQSIPQLFDVHPFLRVPEEVREFVLAA